MNQKSTYFSLHEEGSLTAGIQELYKRLVSAEKWEGSPVEDVDGGPSVHRILDRIGILEPNEVADNGHGISPTSGSESVPALRDRKPSPPAIAPKKKRPVRPAHRKETTYHAPVSVPDRCFSNPSPSPPTATTMSRTSTTARSPSALEVDELNSQWAGFPTLLSPLPSLTSQSPNLSHSFAQDGSLTTATPWQGPSPHECSEEMLSMPLLTPKPEVHHQQHGYLVQPNSDLLSQFAPTPLNNNPLPLPYKSPDSAVVGFYNACPWSNPIIGGAVSTWAWAEGGATPTGGGSESSAWGDAVY